MRKHFGKIGILAATVIFTGGAAAQPANDACDNAIPIDALTTTNISADNTLAANDVDLGTCTNAAFGVRGVWFVVTPPTAGTLVFTETSTVNIASGVWAVPSGGTAALDCATSTASNSLVCTGDEAWAVRLSTGSTYYIQIGNQFPTLPGGVIFANLTWVTTPPANDFCEDAQDVSLTPGVPTSVLVENRFAAADPIDTCASPPDAPYGVWFRITAPAGGAISFINTSPVDGTVVFWQVAGSADPASDCPTFTPGNTLLCPAENPNVGTVAATAGSTYYVLFHTLASGSLAPGSPMSGTFEFSLPPPNDDCANAEVLALPPFVSVPFTVDQRAANPSTPPINVGDCTTSPEDTGSVWYRYDAAAAGGLAYVLLGDLRLAMWETDTAGASCPAAGPPGVECPGGNGGVFTLRAGKTYYILIQARSSVRPVRLTTGTWTYTPPPSNDECVNATPLSLAPSTPSMHTHSWQGASASSPPIVIGTECNFSGGVLTDEQSVWYRFDATANGHISITRSGGPMLIWETLTSSTACPVASPSTYCTVVAVNYTLPVQSGRTYHIMMRPSGLTSAPGNATFTFIPTTGVCCRGATCSTTITTAAACTGSLGGGGAGAAFTAAGGCNQGSASTPCCFGDYNKSGGVTVQDIFDFLAAYFAGGC